MVGCDASVNLLTFCREKHMDCVVSEVQALPFRSASADHFICIAVLHHLASESSRIAAIGQLIRIVKPGGTGLIYVWAFEQSKVGCASKYTSKKKSSSRQEEEEEEEERNERQDTATEGALSRDKMNDCENINDFTCSPMETQSVSLNALPVHESRTPFKQQDVSSCGQMIHLICNCLVSFSLLLHLPLPLPRLSGSRALEIEKVKRFFPPLLPCVQREWVEMFVWKSAFFTCTWRVLRWR